MAISIGGFDLVIGEDPRPDAEPEPDDETRREVTRSVVATWREIGRKRAQRSYGRWHPWMAALLLEIVRGGSIQSASKLSSTPSRDTITRHLKNYPALRSALEIARDYRAECLGSHRESSWTEYRDRLPARIRAIVPDDRGSGGCGGFGS